MSGPIVTLLTDFGTADGYVGEMKGLLLSQAPELTLVDITHDIAPQDTMAARLALARYWRRFPRGTVHIAVVDPGVGSERRAIAVECDGRLLVGPDNGILSPALEGGSPRAVALAIPSDAAPTFHGRDVFVPAALRLALGDQVESLGTAIHPTLLPIPEPVRDRDVMRGVVLTVDRFGNAITNLRGPCRRVRLAGTELRVVKTYADLAVGAAGALIGSAGYLEIAVREGSAAAVLGLARGASVTAE